MYKVYTTQEIMKKLLYKKSESRRIVYVKQDSCSYVKCSLPKGLSLLNEVGELNSKLYDKYRINNIYFNYNPNQYSNGNAYILTDGNGGSSVEYDMTIETMKEVEELLQSYVTKDLKTGYFNKLLSHIIDNKEEIIGLN